jgi:hypothetical protein
MLCYFHFSTTVLPLEGIKIAQKIGAKCYLEASSSKSNQFADALAKIVHVALSGVAINSTPKGIGL